MPIVITDAAALPAQALTDDLSLLRHLGTSAVIVRAGRDNSRVRVVSGTLHGNEPSGARAIVHALRAAAPATDVIFVLGAVQAALLDPPCRHLPRRRDLNRCFRGPFDAVEDDDNGVIARAVLDAIADIVKDRTLEATVDVHNTTGANPDFVISNSDDDAHRALTALFSERMLQWPLRIGTFSEVMNERCCAITFECGRVNDDDADARAIDRVAHFLHLDVLPTTTTASLTTHRSPLRVRVAPGVTVAFGDGDADVVFDAHLDRHNFGVIAPGTVLGRVRAGAAWPLVVDSPTDTPLADDMSRVLCEVRDGALIAKVSFTPLMMTTNAAIAVSDCLFYCTLVVLGRLAGASLQ